MSNSLAIAAVTATLRDILNLAANPLPSDPDPDPDLNDVTCSVKTPDRARTAEGANQLNLFLYQTALHPHLRNTDVPGQVRPGESAYPPLALKLDYLVTAYGKNQDDLLAHRVLGRAMSLLHDRALLMPGEIELALKGADVHLQVERVRITPHPLSTEELSKLWAVFQTPYRVSATYQASVVLIDSSHRTRAPLPVLGRDVDSTPGVTPTFPTIERIELPASGQPAARLPHNLPPTPAAGDALRVIGHAFTGTSLELSLRHRLLAAPRLLAPATTGARELGFTLPDDQTGLPVGSYALTVIAHQGPDASSDRNSNVVALALAPRIRSITPSPAVRNAAGEVAVTVRTSPQIWPAQRASLIVGDVEVLARPRAAKSDQLDFDLSGLPPGTHTYLVRLRVDGVDSLIVDYAAKPPAFVTNSELEVQ